MARRGSTVEKQARRRSIQLLVKSSPVMKQNKRQTAVLRREGGGSTLDDMIVKFSSIDADEAGKLKAGKLNVPPVLSTPGPVELMRRYIPISAQGKIAARKQIIKSLLEKQEYSNVTGTGGRRLEKVQSKQSMFRFQKSSNAESTLTPPPSLSTAPPRPTTRP
jgi:hypothetical protein